MKQKITKSTIDAITATSSTVFLWDQQVAGFGAKIMSIFKKK